ncbi:MAG: hypothetical protein WBP72_01640 [Rhodocyclaceae bacterium]
MANGHDYEVYVLNRRALSAMRQALGFLHRDDPYFDRIYGGAIAQTRIDGGTDPRGDILQRFRGVLQRVDDRINHIAARGARTEEQSLSDPVARHELTDKEAHDLDACHLAMQIYRDARSLETGDYDKGTLIECFLEDLALRGEFFAVLREMETCIHFEPGTSTDAQHQAARLGMPFIEHHEPEVRPRRTDAEERSAYHERLEDMAREEPPRRKPR